MEIADNKVIIDQALGDSTKILERLTENLASLELNKRLTSVGCRFLIMDHILEAKGSKGMAGSALDLAPVKKELTQMRGRIIEFSEESDITDSEITALEKSCTSLEQKLGIDNLSGSAHKGNSAQCREKSLKSVSALFSAVHNEELPRQVPEQLGKILAQEQKELTILEAKITEANKYIELLSCIPNTKNKPNEPRQAKSFQDSWCNEIKAKAKNNPDPSQNNSANAVNPIKSSLTLKPPEKVF